MNNMISEAAVYSNPLNGHVLSIVKHDSHSIITTVSIYDSIDGRTFPLTGFGPNPGLIDFDLPMFQQQVLNVARMFYGQRATDDATPNYNPDQFALLVAALMRFKCPT